MGFWPRWSYLTGQKYPSLLNRCSTTVNLPAESYFNCSSDGSSTSQIASAWLKLLWTRCSLMMFNSLWKGQVWQDVQVSKQTKNPVLELFSISALECLLEHAQMFALSSCHTPAILTVLRMVRISIISVCWEYYLIWNITMLQTRHYWYFTTSTTPKHTQWVLYTPSPVGIDWGVMTIKTCLCTS